MPRPRTFLLLVLALVGVGALLFFLFREPILQRVGVRPPTGTAQATEPTLPPGFGSSLFAEGLDAPRFMTVGPDGTLFVAERGRSRVVALPDRDGDGRADEIVEVAGALDRPSSLDFRPGTNELYVGETSRVTRLTLDGLRVAARDVVIADLPTLRVHFTTTVLFGPDGALYVSIGSTCNVCIEDDPRLAAVWRYEADGSDGQLWTTGLRNAVGLAANPATGEVWATNNGRDLLGNELPPETVYVLAQGADAGWPRCHAGNLPDPDFGTGEAPCAGVLEPVVTMQAHSAPLGLTFYDDDLFPAEYRGDLFVAFHGSWNRYPPTGYKVVRVPMAEGRVTGPVEDFAAGWLQPDGSNTGRPTDVVVAADGALLISDDAGGFIYRIAPTDK